MALFLAFHRFFHYDLCGRQTGQDVAQLVRPSHRRCRFDSPMRQGIFLPESTFNADSLTCVRTPPCAIACINICAHVKDPVVHVGVRWLMETLKHPACTVGWVAPLCLSWLSPGKATRIFHGRNPIGTIQLCSCTGRETVRGCTT